MVIVTDKEYYMDGIEVENLDTASKVVRKDWDMLFAVDGPEGSGKSVKTMQMAYFVDRTFCLDRVVFTPSAFRKAVLESKPYQAIVYDEGYTGLSSRGAMGMVNRTLVKMLAEIRQKNLFVFVVMPTFFDLDKYVALWRSRALIHVYTKDFQRGYFAFYNIDRKKDLYINGKKFYSYAKPRPNFIGRFTNVYVVDEKAYRHKKRYALSEREKKQEEAQRHKEMEAILFERVMHLSEEKFTHAQKIEILSMPSSTYFVKLKQWREKDLIE